MSRRPEGVVEKKGRWYYRPPTEKERRQRKKAGLPETIPLGPADSLEARVKWAELTGRREPAATSNTVKELLDAWAMLDAKGVPAANAPMRTKDNGKPRASGTIKQYAWTVRKILLPRFGAMRYGKTEWDAARGKAIGPVDVQAFVAEVGTTSANSAIGAFSAMFQWARRNGKTLFNPCEAVARIASEGRTREPKPWEVECLGAMAEHLRRKRLALMIDFEAMSGWSSVDMRNLVLKQVTADGIKFARQKTGQPMLLKWNEDLRRVISEALELPGAKRAGRFPLSPVFAARNGKRLSGGAFWDGFRLLVRDTNEALAGCEIPLEITDLGFHDLRSMAGDDADEAGMERHEFLGNTRGVADKHYARRERKVVALPLKRGGMGS